MDWIFLAGKIHTVFLKDEIFFPLFHEDQASHKKFGQNGLGCTCPDKVFEQIEDNRVSKGYLTPIRAIYPWNSGSEKQVAGRGVLQGDVLPRLA